ncbi:MAG: hypothetical protein FJ005_04510 [Chloroflexi bacterium]|nr:hypothetical protein [Chloroflexota bacterium]
MNKVAEHLAQALRSLSKADKTDVIRYLLEDPDVKEAVVKLFIDKLGKPHEGRNSGGSISLGVTSNKEMGMRVRESYISRLQHSGVQIDQVDRIWAKAYSNLWVAIPFATERRPNRWFLGVPESEVFERIRNGGLAIVLLCQSDVGDTLDFVLPPSKVEEMASQLSKSRGQLKFNLKKVGNRYHLVIPDHGTVDVSDYRGNVSIFTKLNSRG